MKHANYPAIMPYKLSCENDRGDRERVASMVVWSPKLYPVEEYLEVSGPCRSVSIPATGER